MKLLGLVVVVVVVGVLAALLQSAEAKGYTVGDSDGWRVPTSNSFYSVWAAGKTFTTDDSLVFNFVTNQHNVAIVSKTAYDACDTKDNQSSIIPTGPATVVLNTTGAHYYICTVGTHCSDGQKLAINVTAAGSSSPSGSGAAASPLPATLSVIFIAIVINLFV